MTRLVVNGCSYIAGYATGNGHIDLASRLNINNAISLAIPGSCNSRIIRTVLKDSYTTTHKTLYVLGITFLNRTELPISANKNLFEGKWLSIQEHVNPYYHYVDHWTKTDTEQFIDLKIKAELGSIEDYLEQLMYQLLSMIGDLINRGHYIIVFRNPGDLYDEYLGNARFTKLYECVNIVNGLSWQAIPWQLEQGIKFDPRDSALGFDIRHPLPGEHGPLNNFLVEYINKHALYLPVLS